MLTVNFSDIAGRGGSAEYFLETGKTAVSSNMPTPWRSQPCSRPLGGCKILLAAELADLAYRVLE